MCSSNGNATRTSRMKMFVGGLCNLFVLVGFGLVFVVLAATGTRSSTPFDLINSGVNGLGGPPNNPVVLRLPTSSGTGSLIGKEEPLPPDDPNDIPRVFFSFRGIPYASPPLAELRWQPPLPMELKSTPHQAQEFKPPCSQWSATKKKVIGAPDCLYLNIFTPYIPLKKRRTSSTSASNNTNANSMWTVEDPNLLPVLVYVHGGEFISGSSSRYSPDALLKRERVVLVTFNYRLGVLGFLSGGDAHDRLTGNFGLMDQLAALKWVQKYVHFFGGNPFRVTIFGSVEHLLLANQEDDKLPLFHAAILKPQSSSILSPFAKLESKEGAKNFLRQFAENVGCTSGSGAGVAGTNEDYHTISGFGGSLIDCLRKADTDSLIRSQTKMLTFHNFPFVQFRANPIGPVVDNILLDDDPEVLFSQGKFREVPLLVGLSANEGFNAFLEFYLKLVQKTIKKDREKVDTEMGYQHNLHVETADPRSVLIEDNVRSMLTSIIQTVMVAVPEVDKPAAFERVFQSIWLQYFGGISTMRWSFETDKVIEGLFRLFGDMLTNVGHCSLLGHITGNSQFPVYSYVFSHGSQKFNEFFKASRTIIENSDGMVGGPKRPKRSLHLTFDTPWDEQYYLFHPVRDVDNFGPAVQQQSEASEEDLKMMDAMARIWVGFAKDGQVKQAMDDLPEFGKWLRMEPKHRSFNYFLISNSSFQRGMRSDFRKAECQFWMRTVPQVRKLSREIHDLETFPILFWSSIAVVVLFALIIITLIVLIGCVKRRTGSYGGADGIYLNSARQL